MQSYIFHHPRGTVFYHLINYLSSTSCAIDLFWKISEIIENIIFSLIFVLQEIWYFRQLRKIKKIWYLRWAFLRKCCFLCSDVSSNGRRPDVECINFLSFEALGVLRLANSETNFFCRTRRLCCFSAFDINALSRCFAWSWESFKGFVFSAVANLDSFKALSEASFDSKVVILPFTRSCAGVSRVIGSLTIDESTSLMACGCYWLPFKESKLGIEEELLPVLLQQVFVSFSWERARLGSK